MTRVISGWIFRINLMFSFIPSVLVLIMAGLLSAPVLASKSHHGGTGKSEANEKSPKLSKEDCQKNSLFCAKTVTSAFAPNGDLWRVWVYQQKMYYQVSNDFGLHFSPAIRVGINPEKISARNENRPKIGFDGKANQERGVYLSWASSLGKRFTSNIRFTYSIDNGQTFADAVTVNDDGLVTGHSFNEMQVNEEGDVSLVWLDSRLRFQAKQQGKMIKGSALYLGKANPRKALRQRRLNSEEDVKFMFSNEMMANDTCVCCRIATDINQNGNMAVFWRHIFGDNIREFAVKTINEDTALTQVSFDHWQIDGCPHQGGGISIDDTNRYHLVWFNQGDKGKGIFYAYSDDSGKNTTKPLAIGRRSASAAHPNVMSNQIILDGKKRTIVDLVWTEFKGDEHQLWHQRSLDNGQRFGDAKMISSSLGGSDRPFIIKHAGQSYVSWHRPKVGHWLQKL